MTTEKYTRVAIALHWLIAILILANVALALSAGSLPDDWVRPVIDTHKSIGITVLGLAILRVLWRAAHHPPPLPASYPNWERFGAHAAHAALYVIIFFLPLSGWLHDSAWNGGATHPIRLFGLIPWPRLPMLADLDPATKDVLHKAFFTVHAGFAYALYGLLALHVVGALKHQFLDRDPELQRMLP